MHSRLAHQAHISCIQLDSRIWGLIRFKIRDHSANNSHQHQRQQVRRGLYTPRVNPYGIHMESWIPPAIPWNPYGMTFG